MRVFGIDPGSDGLARAARWGVPTTADGVAEGETVVTTGNFLLDSESRLRAAVEGRQ